MINSMGEKKVEQSEGNLWCVEAVGTNTLSVYQERPHEEEV